MSLTPGAVQAGMRLGDRYGLAEPIGSGGMARIYRAHDERLVRDVAVKILDPSNSEAQASVNEARPARLTHPGLAQVFDVGRDQGLDHIVMELVPGRSLREVLAERRRLTPAEKVAMTSAQGRVVIEASGWPFG